MYDYGETLKTACGSPCYAAPEMIAGKRYHGLKTDIWSSGVVLYAMVCGYLPFEDPKTSNLYKKILNADYSFPKFATNEAKDFISRILNTTPEERFTISDMKMHPFWRKNKEKLVAGLFPLHEKMPVDEKLLQHLVDNYGFDQEYALKCIEANRHNHITSTYSLLHKKQIKMRPSENLSSSIDYG